MLSGNNEIFYFSFKEAENEKFYKRYKECADNNIGLYRLFYEQLQEKYELMLEISAYQVKTRYQ